MKENLINKEFETRNFGKCVVVHYECPKNVIVMFHKPFAIVKCSEMSLRNGTVRNPLAPSVRGKGYIGVGQYSTMNKRAYSLWISMLDRAYNEDYHMKFPTYCGVSVCDEWLNFQNFAKWCYSNKFINTRDANGRRYQLDKDILIRGNKVYSPETCCFVPQEINLMFSTVGNESSAGVCKKGDKYIGYLNSYGVRKYLGTYDNKESASNAYKEEKELCARKLATKWFGKVDERIINVLLNYTLPTRD